MFERTESTPTHLRCCLVGFGYWGPNLARNLAAVQGGILYGICEADGERRALASRQYPWARTFTSYDEVLNDESVDAVVLATPAADHYAQTRRALLAGKHVLVEKPMATTSKECEDLVDVASRSDRTLMVGHTFLFSPPVQYLRSLIDSGELGDIYYLYSSRLNLGLIRNDVSVLWDLAPHDVSIGLYLLNESPVTVSARGYSYVQPGIEDVIFLTVEFPSGKTLHTHLSWLDPNKVRKMTIVGNRRMVVYDDTDPNMTIQIYDKGVDHVAPIQEEARDVRSFGEFKMLIRSGDLHIPRLPAIEPLREECQNFIAAVLGQAPCQSAGEFGANVVAVLEAAEHSLRSRGDTIQLDKEQALARPIR